MKSFLCEMLVLVLGVAGIVLLILANETDCWRHDAKDPYASVGLTFRCRGLWSECVLDYMANVWTCDVLLSYLGNLPADMVGVRVLIVVTCGVSILAVPPMVCGMKSTKLVSDESGQKQSLICTSGVLYLFAGVSGTGGLLWYGAETFIKYQEEVLLGIPGVTHELGYSYWFAVGGVACMLWSGLALLILNRLACKNGRTQSNRAPADQQPRWATGDKTYV